MALIFLLALYLFCKSRHLLILIIIYYISYMLLTASQYGIQFDSIIYTSFKEWNLEYLYTMAFTFLFVVYAAVIYMRFKKISALLYCCWLVLMMGLDGLMSLMMSIDSNILITCYNYVQNSNLVIDAMFALFGTRNGFKDHTIDYFSRYNAIRCLFNRYDIKKGC